ncbi:MAG: MmcQ/YjbR family DNA-binding protein [Pseudomonadota bacterium]
MTLQEIADHCLALPGAELSIKWGDDHCYTVGEKMFAAHGVSSDAISFKCTPDAFEMLTESGAAEPAKYLARAKWVTAKLGAMPKEELAARLTAAYGVVRSSLTKKLQATLPPFDPAAPAA